MSEHLLDAAQGSAPPSTRSVAKAWRMSWGCKLESRPAWAVRCLKTRRRLSADIALPRVETNRAPPAAVPQKNGTRLVDVAPHGLECERVKRDDALLGSFAEEPHARIGEVDVAELEARYFGDAAPLAYRSSRKA